MALSLTESAKLSQSKMAPGIAEEMLKVSQLLQYYPWIEIVGNSLTINREDPDNMGSVHFRAPDAVWTPSEAKFSQVPFSLYTLGEDCDVPTIIQKTRSNINDQMAAQVKIKSKLMAYEFEDRAIYGVKATSEGFDGLHTLIPTAQQVHMVSSGTTGAALTIAKLDELYDKVAANGRPDVMVMNRTIRRILSEKLRLVGSYSTDRDAYGNYFVVWNETPIIVCDHILQTEGIVDGVYAAPTTGVTSSIFAIRFGEGDGLCGIQSGPIDTEVFPKLETKDAIRTRIKWYCGQALYSTLALARLDGVTAADMA